MFYDSEFQIVQPLPWFFCVVLEGGPTRTHEPLKGSELKLLNGAFKNNDNITAAGGG